MKRNLEQTREGGHDITGVDGWAIEVKRYKKATPALISGWWEQAVDQAKGTERRPALFYREDHGQWRVVVYLDMIYPNLDLSVFPQEMDKTVEMSPSTWVRLVETKELRLIVR